MRVFIAIELPDEVKDALAALQNELRKVQTEIGWTKPENLHLTLKFLGEVEADRLSDVNQACAAAVARVSPFSIGVQDTGVFPTLKQPRVLWVGLAEGLAELQTLHKKLDENLHALGFAQETRAFKPHLTLGRVKSLKNVSEVTAKLLAYHLPELSFHAHELVVMQSQLHPAGSIYTPLAKCLLSAAEDCSPLTHK
jgi:RNA 2',3'-cyclic 3'-phosphodiesterase